MASPQCGRVPSRSGRPSQLGVTTTRHDAAVPPDVDGVRVHYMEKAGKKFCAVRVQSGKNDIVLKNEVLLDPPSHMGHGKRFGPEPTPVESEVMANLLADIMEKNPDQKMQIANARASFSVSGKH